MTFHEMRAVVKAMSASAPFWYVCDHDHRLFPYVVFRSIVFTMTLQPPHNLPSTTGRLTYWLHPKIPAHWSVGHSHSVSGYMGTTCLIPNSGSVISVSMGLFDFQEEEGGSPGWMSSCRRMSRCLGGTVDILDWITVRRLDNCKSVFPRAITRSAVLHPRLSHTSHGLMTF